MKVGIEMLASCESKWSLKGNIINSGEKAAHYPEGRSAHRGVQHVQIVMEECGSK